MTKGEATMQALLALVNTGPLPAGVPQTSRILADDLPPTESKAIRLLSVKEPVNLIHGGKIAALRHRVALFQCWAKSDNTTPLDTLVDPLVEHVITRTEGQKPAASHAAEDAEIRWEYVSRDAGWVKVSIFVPVQFHTRVGDPTQ